MENFTVERLIVGRNGRRYLLYLPERKYERIKLDAARRGESLNRRLNALIDQGLQVEQGQKV